MPTAETFMKMSGKAPKFPSTIDAKVWASRCTAWFGAFKVPDLAEWFQAALSHGFREGQASVYELVDRAQRQRDLYGPVVPGTQAPSDLERLETTMRLHHEWAAKNVGNLRETLEMRTAGLDGPGLKRRLGDLEAAVVNEQGRTMELSVDLKGALDRLAKLEART